MNKPLKPLDGALQDQLSKRAEHIVCTFQAECRTVAQEIHALTAIRDYSTTRLTAVLDGKK